MQTRHRIPTVFNISMVDVLCCALGCVILLWLLNFREARRRAEAAGATAKQLTSTRDQLSAAQARLSSLQAELLDWQTKNKLLAASLHEKTLAQLDLQKLLGSKELRLATLEEALKDKNAKYLALTNRAEDLDLKLASSKKLIAQLEEVLARLRKESGDLTTKLAASEKRSDDMSKQLRSKEARLEELMKQLTDLLTQKKLLEQKLTVTGNDLAQAQRVIGSLQEEKKALDKQAKMLKVAIANRFEGIALTGKKVIFLIDMSGSMKLKDEKTPDPDKWPLVVEAVYRLLLSLTDVTHFQVILFSNETRYALGQRGRWLEPKGEATAKEVKETLLKIEPKGGTNIYPALEECFRYRIQGLDTIYFLSDGLPTEEDNLPAEAAELRGVALTTYLSRRIRSKCREEWNRPLPLQPQVKINTIGFFYESPDVGSFLWALARENQGSFVGMSRP